LLKYSPFQPLNTPVQGIGWLTTVHAKVALALPFRS